MTDSILETTKKLLGIDASYEHFDTDIIIQINSALMIARQLGVPIPQGFKVTGNLEEWSDIPRIEDIEGLKNYIYLRTRLAFDPPVNSFVVEAIKDQIKEYEWRINVEIDDT